MKLHFWTDGDPSVGINGDQTELELDVTGLDERDQAEYISHAKEVLGKAFSEIWGMPAKVMTAEEIDAAGRLFDSEG